jgi:lysozyme
LGGRLRIDPTPVIPPQWPTWTFWRFSETGTVLGVNSKVDLNRFNSLSADLKRLGKGGAGRG